MTMAATLPREAFGAGPTSAAAAPLGLELREVCKAFGQRRVLDGVSLAVRKGEFVALLGSSGAGKTTLIKCMTGLLVPDQGEVYVGGREVAAMRGIDRRRVAVVFQQFNLVRRLSALDNVLAGRLGYVPAWRGLARRFEPADRLLAMECLDRVGLLAQAGQRADTLSGGQQQRVAIARALAQRADLIVADEPVASLDPVTGAGILELLARIGAEQGVAVVCSLHQLHLAQRYAHRLVGLAGGRKVLDGPVDDVDEVATQALYAARTSSV